MKKIINTLHILLFLIILSSSIYSDSSLSEKDQGKFGHAQSLNNLRKYDESLNILGVLHSSYPNNFDIAFEMAKALGFKGDVKKAIVILDSLRQSKQKNISVDELKGSIYEANNQFKDALAIYKNLQKKDPDNQTYILKIARIASWIKDYQTSLSYYEALLKTNSNTNYLMEMAHVYFWNKQPALAFNIYEKISTDKYADEKALSNYAYCAISVKNFNRASEIFLILYKKEEKKEWLQMLASCSEWNGDYLTAITYYKILLEKNPVDSIKEKLANLYYLNNQFEKAMLIYSEIGYRNLKEDTSFNNMQNICLKENNFSTLKTILQELLVKYPSNTEIIHKLAETHMYMKEYIKSIELYHKLLAAAPGKKEYITEIASVYFYNHDYLEAVKFYKQVEADILNDHALLKNYAFSLSNSGKIKEAILYFSNLQKKFPEDLNLSTVLVGLYLRQGEKIKARKLLKTLVMKEPGDKELKLKLAELLAAENEFSESIKLLDEILLNSPENKDALLRKARYLSWSKDYDNSINIYNQIINLHNDWLTPQREKARVLGWQTKYRDSIKTYKNATNNFPASEVLALEKNSKYNYYNNFYRTSSNYYELWLDKEPDNLEALFDLAQIYSVLHDWDKASEYYKECINIFPMHNRAKQALNKGEIIFFDFKTEAVFEHLKAESANRQVDKDLIITDLSVITPIFLDWRTGLILRGADYSFKSNNNVYRGDLNLYLNYALPGWLTFEGLLKYSDLSDSFGSISLYSGLFDFQPSDFISIKGILKKDLFIENEETLKNFIKEKNMTLRAEFHPSRNFWGGFDYNKVYYSDDNKYNGYKYDINIVLNNAPFWLKTAYKYMAKDYDFESLIYFSPKDFYAHYLEVEYRHYFNKEQLYWGAKDMWLLFRYEYNKDKGGIEGHNLGLEYYLDMNDLSNIRIGFSRLDYNQSNIYNEKKFFIKGKYYF